MLMTNSSTREGLICAYSEVTRRATNLVFVLLKTCVVLLPGKAREVRPKDSRVMQKVH